MKTGFLHVVYFWLAADAPADAAEQLMAGCKRNMSGIPGVLRLEVGTPAPSERAVVDSTYGVVLLVEFADSDAQEAYQVHPDHLKFIDECKSLWSRVQVYDSLLAG